MSGVEDTADLLKRFYVELQAWIDGGMPTSAIFSRSRGLCLAIELWAEPQRLQRLGLVRALKHQFTAAGLSPDFPFDGSHAAFIWSVNDGAHFKNPSRLAWIKAHASDEPARGAG